MGRRRNEKWAPESIEKWHQSKRHNRSALKLRVRMALAGVATVPRERYCHGINRHGEMCFNRLRIDSKTNYCLHHLDQDPDRMAQPRAPEPPPARPGPKPAPTAPPAPTRRFRVPSSPFSKRRNG